MVRIGDISVAERKYEGPDLDYCLKLAPEIAALLPTKPKYIVRFKLTQTHAEFANAIRRCLLDELPIKSMDYDEYDEKTAEITDMYIAADYLKQQICLIPIEQQFEYDAVSIDFFAENKTPDIMELTTDHFKITRAGKPIPRVDVMERIVLGKLRPGSKVSVKGISVVSGINKDHGGKYSAFAGTHYEILDAEPYDEDTGRGTPSLIADPHEFLLGYTTHRNMRKPLLALRQCCDTLIGRLSAIAEELDRILSKHHHYSDLIQMETDRARREFQIKGEGWTLMPLIARYCLILAPTIAFVAPAIIHPEKNVGVLRIEHPDFLKLIKDAIARAIADLKIVAAAVPDK